MRGRTIRLALAGMLAVSLPAAAQQVTGRVVDAGTGQAVAGANVLLVDSAGRRVAGWLSERAGGFTLRSQAAGTFRVRAELIGRQTVESEPLVLALGVLRAVTLALPIEPVVLGAIDVSSAKVCGSASPSGLVALHTVREEARKALSSRETALSSGLLEFEIRRYERLLHPVTHAVVEERETGRLRTLSDPFVSAPAEQLARDGYYQPIEGGLYYLHGPSADVLLSGEFLDTHCFTLERDGGHPGQLGLGFAPVAGREVADIEGVFWLDEGTAMLRALDFTYTNLPPSVPAAPHGGRATFERLENGGVMVRAWEIRTPVLDVAELPRDPLTGRRRVGEVIAFFRAEGGEVTRVIERTPRADGAAWAERPRDGWATTSRGNR